MFDEADETIFHHILANNNHVLQSYLPDRSLLQNEDAPTVKNLIPRRRNSMTETFLYTCYTKRCY